MRYLLQRCLLAAIQPVQFLLVLSGFLDLLLLDLLRTKALLDFLYWDGRVDLADFARVVGFFVP